MLDQPSCLIIDDSDVVRKVMRNTVEGLGFQVDDAASMQEAQMRCKRGLPDLIVLDWHLPGESPMDFIATIRSSPKGREVKIIFVITDNDPIEISRAIASGANDCLVKPFYRVNLETKVAALTARATDIQDDIGYYRPVTAMAGAR